MSTDSSARVLYCLGWWTSYYRVIALIVYATGLLLVGFYYPARDLLQRPSFGNVLLLALIAAIVVAWILVGRLAWRDGQSRVTRIILSPGGEAIRIHTLNFGSRNIPLGDLEDFKYQDLTPDAAEYQAPSLTVRVRTGPPLRVDLGGWILDEPTFRRIFRSPPTLPGSPPNQAKTTN